MNGERKPMVKLTEVWERTSAAGNRYFSGFLGASQLLIFDAGEKPHPTRPDETVHVWNVMLQERDPPAGQQDRAPVSRAAERGSEQPAASPSGMRRRPVVEARETRPGYYEAWSQPASQTPFYSRDERPEPDGEFYDDSAEAIRDLREGPG